MGAECGMLLVALCVYEGSSVRSNNLMVRCDTL